MFINKDELNKAWFDRKKNNKFYKMLYIMAEQQARSQKVKDVEDFVQFAITKCFNHIESYNPQKGNAYSFFWKQIYLAILYKKRLEAKKNKCIFMEKEKIIDFIENKNLKEDGYRFSDIVSIDEARLLYNAYKKYNKNNKNEKAEKNKEGCKKVLKWMKENNSFEKFDALKPIFNEWIGR